MKSKVNVADFI